MTARATDYLESGQRVFVGASSNEPTGLLETLRQEGIPEDIRFIQFPIGGLNQVDFTSFSSTASVETFFMTPVLGGASPERVHFLPMQMRWVYDYLSNNVDVALIQVARDRHGTLRLGPNVDFVGAVLNSARIVIAELNTTLVAAAGSPEIPESRISHIVETERTLPELPVPNIDNATLKIGTLVADLIRDGDCIQTGIGDIPTAVLSQLGSKNDLGLHGGIIDDGGMALIERGCINGSQKPLDKGLHVTGMALGSRELMRWLADQPDVIFRGANYTHEVSVINQIPNFVSVNSAVEIDLLGQVNAEYVRGRQVSGTGGSVDFMRAAKASRGGRSIVAMKATARNGAVSRIVSRVELVTALRTDVDMVVTEYGVADLKCASVKDRAMALIAIAAPDFRNELTDAMSKLP